MLLDSLWEFISLASGGQSMVGAAGVAIPFTNTLDLLGQGVGTAPVNIIGNATLFGTDFGVGAGFGKQKLIVIVGTAFTTATAATANISWQFAPDTGAAGGYLPGTWQTVTETGPLTAAQLTAQQIVARFDFPPAFPANLQPRYTRLVMTPPAATNFTAGTISFAGLTPQRDDTANRYAARNYKVA